MQAINAAEESLFGPDFITAPVGQLCSPGVEIRADSSEYSSGVPDLLAELGATVVNGPLEAGDYLVCGRTLVERKTVPDFTQSLYAGRLFDQIKRLKQASDEVLLVIEGGKWYFSQVQPKAVRMAFLSLLVSWKMPVVFTKDCMCTAALLAELGEKELHRKSGFSTHRLFHRSKKKSLCSIEDARMRLVSEIPGVGPVLAVKLMERFQTVRALSEASEADISSVYGVGKQKAAKILWTLREKRAVYGSC
jgi:ERCC4-type nuclease